MKKLTILILFIATVMSLVATDTPDTVIINAADRLKDLAIQSKAIQKPEQAATLLENLHKEIVLVIGANQQMIDNKVELDEARQNELADALSDIFDSVEVITITATQFKEDAAVRKALEDFEAELEKFKQ